MRYPRLKKPMALARSGSVAVTGWWRHGGDDQSAAQQTSGVNAAMAYGTDGPARRWGCKP